MTSTKEAWLPYFIVSELYSHIVNKHSSILPIHNNKIMNKVLTQVHKIAHRVVKVNLIFFIDIGFYFNNID